MKTNWIVAIGAAVAFSGISLEMLAANQKSGRTPPLPKVVVMQDRTFEIKYIRASHLVVDGDAFYGRTCDHYAISIKNCTDVNTFFIRKKMKLADMQDTILHELFHGIVGTENSYERVSCAEFARTVSPKLLRILQRNAKLAAFLRANPGKAALEAYQPAEAETPESQAKLMEEVLESACDSAEVPSKDDDTWRKGHINPGTYHHIIYKSPEHLLKKIQNDAGVMDRLLVKTSQ